MGGPAHAYITLAPPPPSFPPYTDHVFFCVFVCCCFSALCPLDSCIRLPHCQCNLRAEDGVPPMPDSTTTLCYVEIMSLRSATSAKTSLAVAHPLHSPAPLSSRSHLVLLCKHGSTGDHPAQLMG
jgi:hypothetical protein